LVLVRGLTILVGLCRDLEAKSLRMGQKDDWGHVCADVSQSPIYSFLQRAKWLSGAYGSSVLRAMIFRKVDNFRRNLAQCASSPGRARPSYRSGWVMLLDYVCTEGLLCGHSRDEISLSPLPSYVSQHVGNLRLGVYVISLTLLVSARYTTIAT
jgi:hypothetical protein